ncbi:MAG: GNAT family N-acetyltransferase [Ignavibacteriales bacterium]|nr:GNAT family N-acetyltransferase [Ignavibacteriales bacterium]
MCIKTTSGVIILEQNQFKIRRAANSDSEVITNLIFDILKEYGLKTDPEKTDADLTDIEQNYFARNGIFDLLENKNGKIIATVGLYKIDNETCELRKMYLLKDERGKGYGKLLLNHALAKARELGYKKIILETASALKEAIALYEKHGFKRYFPEHLSGRCDKGYYLELSGKE